MQQFDSVICVSQTPWLGPFQNSAVQLMTELAGRYPVLYVNYQYTFTDDIRAVQGKRSVPVRATLGLADSLQKRTFDNGSSLHVLIPPVAAPINWMNDAWHDRLLRWNVKRLVKSTRAAMRRLGMKRPLVINAFNPVWGVPMLGQLNECATLYYCFDEISAGYWVARHGTRYEKEYLERVDAVITTSEALRRSKSKHHERVFCLKNGVNFGLFNTTLSLINPAEPRPNVIGYLGVADNRLDMDIVEYCAQQMPTATFQFIGEVKPSVEGRLKAIPNVAIIPPHRPAELPALMAKMGTTVIPFLCNEHTYTIYPLKINEYLAAGLSVVSTPFSFLDDFTGTIELADTPEAFHQALLRALADYSPDRVAQRIALAKQNSWTERANEFDAIVRQVPGAWS